MRPATKLLTPLAGMALAVPAVAGTPGAAATPTRPGGTVSMKAATRPESGSARPGTAVSAEGASASLPDLDAYQLAGQRTIYSYDGLNPPWQLLWAIRHGRVGGVVFFSQNVGSVSHLRSVITKLRNANAAKTNPVRLPLLLMTDQEGGVVRRLPGWPTMSEKQVGDAAHPDQQASTAGRGAGITVRGADLNVNLAPVLGVYRSASDFLDQYGRSFGRAAGKVAQLGSRFVTAMQHQGVAATGKHFPGLGAATRSQNTDARPVTLNIPLSTLRGIDEAPFRAAIAAKAKLIMVSWAVYPALDNKRPAGLSSTVVLSELRGRLGFPGVTITDAIEASALKNFGATGNRVQLAARAGMDLMLCARRSYDQGRTAMLALRAAYKGDSAKAQGEFKVALERVLSLRASLAG